MSTAQSRKIILRGSPRHDEAVAAGAIKPGHLIKLNSNDKVVVHASEGGYAEIAVAVEDALQGRTIDDAYASTGNYTRVSYAILNRGDEAAMFLKAGSEVAVGDLLYSAGNGTLIPVGDLSTSTIEGRPLFVAREALDLTGSGDVDTRLRVRAL